MKKNWREWGFFPELEESNLFFTITVMAVVAMFVIAGLNSFRDSIC